MTASLLPDEEVWRRADRFELSMRRALRRVRQQPGGVLANGPGVNSEEEDALNRLADEGMVDPGYDGLVGRSPDRWAMNGNGERALKYFSTAATTHDDTPRDGSSLG